MHIFIIIDSITMAGVFLLGITSLLKGGYKNPINKYYATFSIFLVIWISNFDFVSSGDMPKNIGLLGNYLGYSTAVVMEVLFILFVSKLTDNQKYIKTAKWTALIFTSMFIVSASPLFVSDVVKISTNFDYWSIVYGPLTWLYLVTVTVLYAIAVFGGYLASRTSSRTRRQQTLIVIIGFTIAVLPVIITGLVMPMMGLWQLFPYHHFTMTVLDISLYYSVIRYHLFDIRLAAVRTLAYTLTLGLLIAVYYLLVILISRLFTAENDNLISQKPLDIVLTFALLFIFPPIKRFFDQLTNRIFYRDYYNSDAFIDRFNKILTSTTNLRHLLEQSAVEIASTLKSERAFFLISTHDGHHITAGTENYNPLSKTETIAIQNATAHLLKKLSKHIEVTKSDKKRIKKNDQIILASLLDESDSKSNELRRLMDQHKIEVILPLVHHGLLGYLLLGDHRTSHYTNRDVKVLSMIDNGLVVAIQNALSVEAIRESNAELRQIDKIKDEFVSVASHELRTPMTVIRGYVNLLQRQQLGPQNDEQQNVLTRINENTQTLISLVGDMLDLSKLEAHKLGLNLSTCSVDDLVKHAIDQVNLMYTTKGLKLTYSPTNRGLYINTDPAHFDRIMTNLLSNAYKFTEKGGVNIHVKLDTTNLDNKGDMVVISVIDTGIGIPPEAMEKLFNKFSQVDNYLQRTTGGTGLGLAICRRLVAHLGGKIGVESVVDKGSKFWFELPISKK
ncbi:MAG: ATP-binding protein [Candidatus Saccharibacteria bacterium]